jgi:hypothetical protein
MVERWIIKGDLVMKKRLIIGLALLVPVSCGDAISGRLNNIAHTEGYSSRQKPPCNLFLGQTINSYDLIP